MGLILFLVANILLYILSVPMILFGIILEPKNINGYFHKLAFSIDQLGNVLCAPLFNKLLIKSNVYKAFGDPDETISHVLGVNYFYDNLKITGKIIAKILNKLDKDHVQKAHKNEQ